MVQLVSIHLTVLLQHRAVKHTQVLKNKPADIAFLLKCPLVLSPDLLFLLWCEVVLHHKCTRQDGTIGQRIALGMTAAGTRTKILLQMLRPSEHTGMLKVFLISSGVLPANRDSTALTCKAQECSHRKKVKVQ